MSKPNPSAASAQVQRRLAISDVSYAVECAAALLPTLRIGQMLALCFDDGVYDLFTVSDETLIQLLQDLPSRLAPTPLLKRVTYE